MQSSDSFERLFTPKIVPEQRIIDATTEAADVSLWVKRLDLASASLSGNKLWKLKYHLQAAMNQGHRCVLTFGGAYSNHIVATAFAGNALGLQTIGIIRGEQHHPLNPVLSRAVEQGMALHYLDRTTYRNKTQAKVKAQLEAKFGQFYSVPEGGSSLLAIRGSAEINATIRQPFDVVCCACGTGGTLAGLVSGLTPTQSAIGISVLKGGDFLIRQVSDWLQQLACQQKNWDILLDYHFGGFAKSKPPLVAFMKEFTQQHSIPVEPVYTGKMFYAIYALMRQRVFTPGCRIVALHTGGVVL